MNTQPQSDPRVKPTMLHFRRDGSWRLMARSQQSLDAAVAERARYLWLLERGQCEVIDLHA